MPLGWLDAEVVLDYPSNIPRGPASLVTGNVAVEYKPPTNRDSKHTDGHIDDLFGPLHMSVIFFGVIRKTYSGDFTSIPAWTNGAAFPTLVGGSTGEESIFQEVKAIHDGPLRAKLGEIYTFPFAVRFPERAQISGTMFLDSADVWQTITPSQ